MFMFIGGFTILDGHSVAHYIVGLYNVVSLISAALTRNLRKDQGAVLCSSFNIP